MYGPWHLCVLICIGMVFIYHRNVSRLQQHERKEITERLVHQRCALYACEYLTSLLRGETSAAYVAPSTATWGFMPPALAKKQGSSGSIHFIIGAPYAERTRRFFGQMSPREKRGATLYSYVRIRGPSRALEEPLARLSDCGCVSRMNGLTEPRLVFSPHRPRVVRAQLAPCGQGREKKKALNPTKRCGKKKLCLQSQSSMSVCILSGKNGQRRGKRASWTRLILQSFLHSITQSTSRKTPTLNTLESRSICKIRNPYARRKSRGALCSLNRTSSDTQPARGPVLQ